MKSDKPIKKGTKLIFTSRLKINYPVRVMKDVAVGDTHALIKYEQSSDKASVSLSMLTMADVKEPETA